MIDRVCDGGHQTDWTAEHRGNPGLPQQKASHCAPWGSGWLGSLPTSWPGFESLGPSSGFNLKRVGLAALLMFDRFGSARADGMQHPGAVANMEQAVPCATVPDFYGGVVRPVKPGPQNPDGTICDDFIVEVVQAARELEAQGKSGLPLRERAMKAGTDRRFGIELEFKLPPEITGVQVLKSMHALAVRLHAMNTTMEAFPRVIASPESLFDLVGNVQIHPAMRRHANYTRAVNGGSLEIEAMRVYESGYVGEWKTPVMSDEPEYWEPQHLANRAITDATNGKSHRDASTHFTIGLRDLAGFPEAVRVDALNNILASVLKNEDVMYRLSTDPGLSSGKPDAPLDEQLAVFDTAFSRPLLFRQPNKFVTHRYPDALSFVEDQGGKNLGERGRAMNVQGNVNRYRARVEDRVEFRTSDARERTEFQQALALFFLGLVDHAVQAAKDGVRFDFETNGMGLLGMHFDPSMPDLKDVQAVMRDIAPLRPVLDMFPDNEDKAVVIGLFALTCWHPMFGQTGRFEREPADRASTTGPAEPGTEPSGPEREFPQQPQAELPAWPTITLLGVKALLEVIALAAGEYKISRRRQAAVTDTMHSWLAPDASKAQVHAARLAKTMAEAKKDVTADAAVKKLGLAPRQRKAAIGILQEGKWLRPDGRLMDPTLKHDIGRSWAAPETQQLATRRGLVSGS
ncbi:MAG: hypothetical protein ABW032_00635 [Burkholderiaceae bacterium]